MLWAVAVDAPRTGDRARSIYRYFAFLQFRSSAFVHCTCVEDTHRLERGLHMINS